MILLLTIIAVLLALLTGLASFCAGLLWNLHKRLRGVSLWQINNMLSVYTREMKIRRQTGKW